MNTDFNKMAQYADLLSSYKDNLYKGVIKPFRPRSNGKPRYIKVFTIGKAGKYFTNLKVWLREPNRDYPEESLFFGISNGNASSYSRLEDISELQDVINWLEQVKQEIVQLQPEMEAKRKQIEEAEKAYQERIQMLQALIPSEQETGGDEE